MSISNRGYCGVRRPARRGARMHGAGAQIRCEGQGRGKYINTIILLIDMRASGGAIISRSHHRATACTLTWRSSSPDSRAWHRRVRTCTKLADPQAAERASPRWCEGRAGGAGVRATSDTYIRETNPRQKQADKHTHRGLSNASASPARGVRSGILTQL